ncbi:MAG: 3,4-dehydroadipyl-CoA semialdehyde dehydrogenase [Deltaproteobacteria bacterium]|nr:3,4-dehydroadipyl-CoA semialdehyde dehydrogenase [Deltaproteobacteria bacterium]
MQHLESYLQGRWQRGQGDATPIHDANTGAVLADACSRGLDLGAALSHARDVGGPALRALTFAERGAILMTLSRAIRDIRDELLDLEADNMGSTRGDAKFDVDGASGTLAFYAQLGSQLGDRRTLVDGEEVRLSRSARWVGQHVLVPRRGAAIHINAFNFPAWNMAEKLAAALLAGVPVLTKPATATAVAAERVVRAFVDTGALPDGALSLLCGSVGDLLDHVGPQDAIVFTGSGDTGRKVKGHPAVLRHNVPVNVEADSLNAAVVGPDIGPGDATWDMAVTEIVRELGQKAGQKCTAIRRILVPAEREDDLRAALLDRFTVMQVGDPRVHETTVGALSTPQQKTDVEAGVAAMAAAGLELAWQFEGDVPSSGSYVAPRLFRSAAGADAPYVHEHEVFGPVATLLPYSGDADEAAGIVARGGGSLVSSVFSDDADWAGGLLLELAAWNGRLYWGSAKVADGATGHGAVMPGTVHGGPGKAGGGEELGGERGLRFYLQRCAIQGDAGLLRRLLG